MIETVLLKIFESALSVAKEVLGKRVSEKADKIIENKKRDKENESINKKQLLASLIANVKSIDAEIVTLKREAITSLTEHIKELDKWSNQIDFIDLNKPKHLNQIYIDLDTYLMPFRTHFSHIEGTVGHSIFLLSTKLYC